MNFFPKVYADAVARLRVPSGFLIVVVFAWFSRPYELLRQCAASLGDTFTLRIRGWGPQIFVTRPEAIRDVAASSDRVV